MLRTLGTVAVAGLGGYLAANGGATPWIDFGELPSALIAFTLISGAIIYGLRSI